MTPERATELWDLSGTEKRFDEHITRFANLCQAEALDEVAAELDGQGVNSLAWKLGAKAAELRKQS